MQDGKDAVLVLQERVQESVRLATIQMKEEMHNKKKRGRLENEEYNGDESNLKQKHKHKKYGKKL